MPAPHTPLVVPSWVPLEGTGSADDLGGKALGLLSLPASSTPPFAILGRRFREAWEAAGMSAERAFAAATPEARAALARLISQSQTLRGAEGLIVRSNAPSEASSDVRGRYFSQDVAPVPSEVFAAIDQVLAQPSEQEAVFAIVQIRMRRQAIGHLSNERRVAERPTQWLIEEVQSDGDSTKAKRRIAIGASEALSFDVGDRDSLYESLRSVAAELRRRSRERQHCEWVWDGDRLWILQRDTIRPKEDGYASRYLEAKPGPAPSWETPSTLRCLRYLGAAEAADWSKLSRRYTMGQLGFPVAPVYLLAGPSFAEERSRGFPDLRHDLEALVSDEEPLVVRTDLVEQRRDASLSLPTSSPLTSVDSLLEWMTREARKFAEEGRRDSEWAFLPAPLVPAGASVMVQARPKTKLLRLDALWGFPDGVGCLPHDSYFLQPQLSEVRRRKAYKGTCLLWSPEHGWTFEAVSPPHDWLEVLSGEEITCAASWARQLADHLGREVQLMVLARIDGRRGPRAMLPWHYTDHTVPPRRRTLSALPPGRLVVISEPDDLDEIQPEQNTGIVFRPAVEWRREPRFVRTVASRAAELRLPIFFEGSTLGHTFYLLSSEGANVVSIGGQAPEVPPDDYNKLVRDRIPEIVKESGGRARVVRADDRQAGWLLRQKLIEEAFEVWGSGDGEIVGELADLMEVLHALLRHLSLDPAEVEKVREEKRRWRGGFDELTFLEYTTSDSVIEEADGPGGDTLLDPALEADITEPDQPRASDRVTVKEEQSSVRFRVPVVPPLQQGIPLRTYSISVGATKVSFRHDDSFLEMTVESPSPTDADQLELPIDPFSERE